MKVHNISIHKVAKIAHLKRTLELMFVLGTIAGIALTMGLFLIPNTVYFLLYSFAWVIVLGITSEVMSDNLCTYIAKHLK